MCKIKYYIKYITLMVSQLKKDYIIEEISTGFMEKGVCLSSYINQSIILSFRTSQTVADYHELP